MAASGSPTSPLHQQGNSQHHPPNSAPHLKHPYPRTIGICTHSSSSAAWMKPRRTSPSSSPPSSSSSSSRSSDSLSPTSIDFKRSRHRQRSRSPALFSLQSVAFQERVEDCQVPVAEITPPTAESLRFGPHRMPSSSRSIHPPLQVDIAHSMDTLGMCFENVLKSADVDKEEDNRKLRMWRTACAMAHAYIHRRDAHRHELHQCDLHELSQHHGISTVSQGGPDQQGEVNVRSTQLSMSAPLLPIKSSHDGPHKKGEFNVRSTQLSKSVPHLAPLLPIKSSHGDEVCPSSMCDHLNDVVCIDEIVNPTQAAEWFGALFLSNSTLVS